MRRKPKASASNTRPYVPDVTWVPMYENLDFKIVPKAGIEATNANAMAEAINAYSIAVAPDSSFIKPTNFFMSFSNLRKNNQLLFNGLAHSVTVPTTPHYLARINTP
jgi:hypothetical protein